MKILFARLLQKDWNVKPDPAASFAGARPNPKYNP
jgi:hypothetical protein